MNTYLVNGMESMLLIDLLDLLYDLILDLSDSLILVLPESA